MFLEQLVPSRGQDVYLWDYLRSLSIVCLCTYSIELKERVTMYMGKHVQDEKKAI